MVLKSLEFLDLADIVHTFNCAFADYIVPVRLDERQLQRKVIAENIDLACSAGAFDGGELVGLILHGRDELNGDKVLYNGGTGVLPEYRGQGLVGRFYEFLGPRLIKAGFDHCLLEVITTNVPAIRAYEKVGFRAISSEVVRPPFELSQPEGWLGQSLCDDPVESLLGDSSCVNALSKPVYW